MRFVPIINDFSLSSHFLFDRKFARDDAASLERPVEIVGTGTLRFSRASKKDRKFSKYYLSTYF